MNCRTSAIGVTTAGARLPSRGTDENAMPQRVQAEMPRSDTQPKVSHFAGLSGSGTLYSSTATTSSSAVSRMPVTSTITTLPMKYEARGIGVPASRFRTPRSRSIGI